MPRATGATGYATLVGQLSKPNTLLVVSSSARHKASLSRFDRVVRADFLRNPRKPRRGRLDQDGFFHQRVFAVTVGDSIARCRAPKPLNKDSVGVGAELYYKGADMCYFARRTRRLR
jgi:hypothetical protein